MAWSPSAGTPGGGGGSVQPVTPPAAASESVASGGSLADVTFSAFTDPGSRIASYTATKTNVSGSATISGTGLGPYAISGEADGEVLTIELDAKDSGGDVLATAVYTGTVAAPGGTGESWTSVVDLDCTALTAGALSNGTNTVDGWTIETDGTGGSIDSNGINPPTNNTVGVDLEPSFTDLNRPIFLQMELSNITWSGSDPARVRVAMDTVGMTSPSLQLNGSISGGDMRTQPVWQPNATPGGSSTLVTGDIISSVITGSPATFYVNALLLEGNVIVWATETRTAPTTLLALFQKGATRHNVTMFEGDEDNAARWLNLLAGGRQNTGGTTYSIAHIYAYEWGT